MAKKFVILSLMKRAILKIAAMFGLTWAVLMVMKPVFLAVYGAEIGASAADWLRVLYHGAAMDATIAGYLTVVPAILAIASLAHPSRVVVGKIERIYFAVVSLVLSTIYVSDLALYGYWGFRLDMTPVFYLTTSPSAALASAPWYLSLLGLLCFCHTEPSL